MKSAGRRFPFVEVQLARPWLWLGAVLVGVWFVVFEPDYKMFVRPQRSDWCVTHHKQVVISALMYSGEYDDRLVPVARWADTLQAYLSNEENFNCVDPAWAKPYGHAVDSRMGGVKEGQFGDTANRPYFFDTTSSGRSVSDPLATPRVDIKWDSVAIAWLDGHCSRKDLATFRKVAANLREAR